MTPVLHPRPSRTAVSTRRAWLRLRNSGWWLAGILCLFWNPLGPMPALAQQSSPLAGQGRAPADAGYDDLYGLPVFVSVELLRLQEIDEQQYEFFAIFNVQQTWYDPRADAVFRIIEAKDLLSNSTEPSNLYNASVACAGAGPSAPLNLTSPDCAATQAPAPECKKYCTTLGQATDNPFRCCDLVWLPDIDMTNLIDTTQDRLVFDKIEAFQLPPDNLTFVHRTTRVQGRFYTPLKFQKYPFDEQKLQVFLETPLLQLAKYQIVPSATFRHLNPEFGLGSDGNLDVISLARDELAGWSIRNLSLQCTNFTKSILGAIEEGEIDLAVAKLWLKTQDYNPDDPYAQYFNASSTGSKYDLQAFTTTCVFAVEISRLSSTLCVQSVLPVAFVGCLAFVVFFASPDWLDLRLSTSVSLFLSLTAVQFIFVSMLPLTSYLTAFDIFIILTYCIIVAIVIESLIVYYISTREEREAKLSKTRESFEGLQPGLGQACHESSRLMLSRDRVGEGGEQSATRDSIVDSACDMHVRTTPASDSPGGQLPPACPDVERDEDCQRHTEEENCDGIPPPADTRKYHPRKFFHAATLPQVTATLKMADDKFASDSAFAYRVARKIDVLSGAFLFFVYTFISIWNFTYGFA